MAVVQFQPPMPSYPFSIPLSLSLRGAPSSPTELRKRTTSFSTPAGSSRPRKRLHRTETAVDLTALTRSAAPIPTPTTYATPLTTPPVVPYNRTLKYYKEQKDRRKGTIRRDTDSSASATPSLSRSCATLAPSVPLSLSSIESNSTTNTFVFRQLPTSPLAQKAGCHRALVLPTPAASCSACGPAHPPPPTARTRTKPKATADLHRKALTACMRESPEGAKILRMGARLAVEIMSATKELERLCGGSGDSDDLLGDEDAMGEIDDDVAAALEDIEMEDAEREVTPEPEPAMSKSWVVIGQGLPLPLSCGREITPQREDWEIVMVDCVA
uniref:Uncharacterized protein n=1 Tax=Mycena chlorophos TaxID=658473 RepID=A0ABQ0LN14_MYCCL|nr:predicted protein [Mycena chlorophos]